mgnify:CR=1 FL=1
MFFSGSANCFIKLSGFDGMSGFDWMIGCVAVYGITFFPYLVVNQSHLDRDPYFDPFPIVITFFLDGSHQYCVAVWFP